MAVIVGGEEVEFDEIVEIRQQPANKVEYNKDKKVLFLMSEVGSNLQLDLQGDGADEKVKLFYFTRYKKEGEDIIIDQVKQATFDGAEEAKNDDVIIFNIMRIQGFYFEAESSFNVQLN